MGVLSLCFIFILAVCGPYFGQGNTSPPLIEADLSPCQPLQADQGELCKELQTLTQEHGDNKYCKLGASCNTNIHQRGRPVRRKSPYRWGECYCDELCEEIGDCCVDYDMWHTSDVRSQSKKLTYETCRRAPSHDRQLEIGYLMIAKCPPLWKGTETAHSCSSINYTADPLTALPVQDIAQNITFANMYCAICHGKSKDLHLWSIKFSLLRNRHPRLDDIRSPPLGTFWKVIPFGAQSPPKCVVTPIKSHTEPNTKLKDLCRSYANAIFFKIGRVKSLFKNPHCALMAGYNLSSLEVSCGEKFGSNRFPLKLSEVLFTFSLHSKQSRTKSMSVQALQTDVNCSLSEYYDPFREKCMPLPTVPQTPRRNHTHSTANCQGPNFLQSEFQILRNGSVSLHLLQKIYPIGSYILVNQTVILCVNTSLINYTRSTGKPCGNEGKPELRSLTLLVLTYVGFSLSIIALLFLMITYFLFPELRTYPGQRVMHLSSAMIAMQSVYFVTDPDVVSSAVCVAMGALLHYLILTVFLWMSTIAYSTQRTFSNPNVSLSNPGAIARHRKTHIRYCIICWGVPLAIVGICVALQLTNTGNIRYATEEGCQLSLPARTYAVAFPVSGMIFLNIVSLIRTVVFIKQLGQGNVAASRQRNLPLIVLKLTAVMGISWILGFVMAFHPTPYIEYPFVIVNSFQGVFICFSFMVNKRTFTMYRQRFTRETSPSIPAEDPEEHA